MSFGIGGLCTDSGSLINFVHMPTGVWFSKFLFFYCSVFSTKYFKNIIILKLQKYSNKIWIVKIPYIQNIFGYLFKAFVLGHGCDRSTES